MRNLILILLLFSTTTSLCQTKQFNGTWTKITTTYEFDFDLILKVKESNQVEGYFIWKVVHYDEYNISSKQYYENKIGMTAKEYVIGTYNHSEAEYILKGYKKEDPNAIIGMDTYKLKIGENGNIGGTTNANGTWLGRINAKQNELELL